MKTFAVTINSGTPLQRNAITTFFSGKEYPVWHWIDDFWIVQTDAEQTPSSIYESISRLPPISAKTMLVFEIEQPIRYWGMNQKQAWDWLSKVGFSE